MKNKNDFKFHLKESIDLEPLTAPGKPFHSLGAQTENARSAVERCALELVAGTASLLISEADLKPD